MESEFDNGFAQKRDFEPIQKNEKSKENIKISFYDQFMMKIDGTILKNRKEFELHNGCA